MPSPARGTSLALPEQAPLLSFLQQFLMPKLLERLPQRRMVVAHADDYTPFHKTDGTYDLANEHADLLLMDLGMYR